MINNYLQNTLIAACLVLATSLVAPITANAGPLGCAKAIADCVGGGKKVADKIKASRQACEALRDCKKVCKVDKKDAKQDAKKDKKSCMKSCDSLKGKKKRQCKSDCRQDKRSDKRDARQDKRACVQTCRDNYKTKACKKARNSMALTIAGQGLKCAAKVTAQCGPTAP